MRSGIVLMLLASSALACDRPHLASPASHTPKAPDAPSTATTTVPPIPDGVAVPAGNRRRIQHADARPKTTRPKTTSPKYTAPAPPQQVAKPGKQAGPTQPTEQAGLTKPSRKPAPPAPAVAPEPAPPAAKIVPRRLSPLPRSSHVRFEVSEAMLAMVHDDGRMVGWLKRILPTLETCYGRLDGRPQGTVRIGITMHENRRPTTSLGTVPGGLTGLVGCATTRLLQKRPPLFTGREGQRHSVGIRFGP